MHDDIQRHGSGQFDRSEKHAAGVTVGARLALRRCPVAESARKFGAADELAPRLGDMNQGEVAGSKQVAMPFSVASERPHFRAGGENRPVLGFPCGG
ncbi:MAG: hypothetical protein MZW92_35130 [Comamonadaceae bacterium]|nr:hypothetical protein [Comamonadaceae bacterium]